MIDDNERTARVSALLGVTIVKDLSRAMQNPFREEASALLCDFANLLKVFDHGNSKDGLQKLKKAQNDFAECMNIYLSASDWGEGKELVNLLKSRINDLATR